MSAKIFFVLCAQAFFVQIAFSQCTSRAAVSADRGINGSYGLDAPYAFTGLYGLDAPYGLAGSYGRTAPYGLEAPFGCGGPALDFSPTSGGGLSVTSSSAIPPIGLSVTSENLYEGVLASAGELPFVGTVGLESVLPTAGAGAIDHHCGDGINAMVSDNTAFATGYIDAAYTPATAAIAPSLTTSGLGYRTGWAGKACGCGF